MSINPFSLLPNETLANIFEKMGEPQTTMLVSKRWLAISQIFFVNVLNEYKREAGVNPHLKPFVDGALEQILEGSVTIGDKSYDFLALKRIQEIYRFVSEAHVSLFGQTPFASPLIPGDTLHNIGVERIKQEVHRIELKKANNLISLCWMIGDNNIPEALSLWQNTLQLNNASDPWCYSTSGMALDDEEIFQVADTIQNWIQANRDLLGSQTRIAVGLNSEQQENPNWTGIGARLTTRLFLTLPKEFGDLTRLEKVYLDHEGLCLWPSAISTFTHLRVLDLSNNALTSLPHTIENMVALKTLFLAHNYLTALPESIGNLTRLENLNLNHNRLTTLPRAILHLENLRYLDLRDNAITTLPPLRTIENLDRIFIFNNPILTGSYEQFGNTIPSFRELVASNYVIDFIIDVRNYFETSSFIIKILICPVVASLFIFTIFAALHESAWKVVGGLPCQLLLWTSFPTGAFARTLQFLTHVTLGTLHFCFRSAIASLILAVQSLYVPRLDRKAVESSIKSYLPFL